MKIVECPYCSQPGAQKSLFKTRCPNPMCVAYDPDLRGGLAARSSTAAPGTIHAEGGALQPKPGELLAEHGEGEPGKITVKKTVKVKAGGGGCGLALFLAFLAFIAFQNAIRRGGLWWAAAAVLFGFAWRSLKSATVSLQQQARREAYRRDLEKSGEKTIEFEEPFDASGPHAIEIGYRNWKGEDKTFIGDRRTMRRKGRHLSVRVAPEGVRIALSLDRIRNRPEVESHTPA